MKTTLRTTEHYNIGPYEWVEIGAEVEADIADPADFRRLEAALDSALDTGRTRVRDLSANPESFIHEHPALGES